MPASFLLSILSSCEPLFSGKDDPFNCNDDGSNRVGFIVMLSKRFAPSEGKVLNTLSTAHSLLKYRQEMFSANQSQPLMPIHLAILRYGIQNCSRLHDKVFGLLGLTSVRLKPSYAMSTLELYVRVLVEGMNEIILIESPTMRMMRLDVFCVTLLSILDLNERDLPVVVSTEFVFKCFNIPAGHLGELIGKYHQWIGDYQKMLAKQRKETAVYLQPGANHVNTC